jgi:biotin transporter BioY
VTVGYIIGFFVVLAVLGWHPDAWQRPTPDAAPTATSSSGSGPRP